MKNEVENNALWLMIRAGEPGQPGQTHFVRIDHYEAFEVLRNQYANQDLSVSMCLYCAGHADADRIYPLYFWICGKDLNESRVCALEAAYYMAEHYGIPDDQIEFLYDGNTSIVLIVPPSVFGGRPIPLMPAMNYDLARQMSDDGVSNVDIDVYQRDSFMPLPNSANTATGRFAIPLTSKELLYLDGNRIAELSKQPRPDDSIVHPQYVPEAAEWFAEIHAEYEKNQRRQNELRKLIQQQGWEIPPCIRRLLWLDADKNTTLEACRLISGTYSFLGSNEAESRYHIMRLARRNAMTGFDQYERLKKVVAFAFENPMLAECWHFLLTRFCPAGGCFMRELIRDYEQPGLFEQV